jgi:ACT domain-containing protein
MNLNANDYGMLLKYIKESISSYYNYHNSVFGIMDAIKNDYSGLNLDASEIQSKLADPNNMSLLREVLAKLG